MSTTGKRVLVADDMPHGRELMRTVLERCGYHVLEASNGIEALQRIQDGHPDLVLLDIQMPGLNGYDVLAKIREDERFAKLPVIAVTANAMQGDRERALAAGFTQYLAKPVSLSTLRNELSALL